MLMEIDEQLTARAVRLIVDYFGENPSVTDASAEALAKQVGIGKESV